MIHKHHIIPKHMGGSDDPSNLISLSVEEHAEEHRKLWEKYGHWQDKIAWKTLSGQISIQEAKMMMLKHDNPMHKPEVIDKMSGENHWSKRPGNVHNWVTNNPMCNPDIAEKLSGENHWSKRPGKIHNSKVNHPKGSSKKIMVLGKVYDSLKVASNALNMNVRKIKKLGTVLPKNKEIKA